MTSFVILKCLSGLATPPASLLFGMLVALVLKFLRLRRLAAAVAVLTLAHTLILSFPPVGDALMKPLEDQARAEAKEAPACCYDAIVVLGGAIESAMPPFRDFPRLTDASDRIWHAARLYHRGIAPRVVVSGGSFLAAQGASATSESEAMRLFLIDLGVPSDAIVSENKALNTIDNMRLVRLIVGDSRVALVTSAFHMPRALAIARHVKLNAWAFPADFRTIRETRAPWENWTPSIGPLVRSDLALHEYEAMLFDFRDEGSGI